MPIVAGAEVPGVVRSDQAGGVHGGLLELQVK